MITFKDIQQTKKECVDADKIFERLENIKSAYRKEDSISIDSMKLFNKLLGKYYNMPKKTVLKMITQPNPTVYAKNGERIEFSKTGIGFTGEYSYNIRPYNRIFKEQGDETKGFIDDIIKDDILFEATKKCMSDNGKQILDKIKEIYNQTKPQVPERKIIIKNIKLSIEEQEIFPTTKKEYVLELTDSSEKINISFKEKGKIPTGWGRGNVLIETSQTTKEEQTNFLAYLFIQNHAPEYNTLLNQYEKETADNNARWEKFDELVKFEFSKYLILEKI